jgi:hypothetical protein
MVIWKVTGNSIGANETGALYCETKEEAAVALREYRQTCKEQGRHFDGQGPEKLMISNRKDLCQELNNATGYGGT